MEAKERRSRRGSRWRNTRSLGSSVRLMEIRIECDVLRGFGQSEIHAVSTFVTGGKCSIGGDGHIVGICVVVGMHDAVDARGGDLIAGPEGVRTHVMMPFRPLLVVPGSIGGDHTNLAPCAPTEAEIAPDRGPRR